MSETNEKDAPNGEDEKQEKPKATEETPIETLHEITINGKTLKYKATAGRLPLKNAEDDIEAQLFFIAYTLETDTPKNERPLVFVFNGGPGSSSVWLHLGALGPYRTVMQDEGWMPAPPYRLEANPHTWLDVTDLVFIDPVGTGYSRAVKPDDNKKYWGLKSDLDSITEFIRLYLTRYERWSSPLYLAGESYGTTRAAGLSATLLDKGIALNGIVLISVVLNFQTIRFTQGNDLPYMLYVPSYTATAWYHNALPEDLQSKSLEDVLKEVEAWANNDYALALGKGDRLTDDERQQIVDTLARYTGLEPRHIDQTELRINIMRFCKELLRHQKRTVGRLDSRFKGTDKLAVTEFPDFDPSLVAITPPYTATFNDYVRSKLGYETDLSYEILSFEVNQNWEYERGQFPDTSDSLRNALARNPFMKILVSMGYYDLATPYLATHYTLDHMGLNSEHRDNFRYTYYKAGHMFYLDVQSLGQFKDDVAAFITDSSG